MRRDQAQHAVLRTALAVGLAAVVSVVAGGMVLTASVLTLVRITAGSGEALGGRPWFGRLLTGAAVLFAIAVALGATSCACSGTGANA